MVMLKPKPGYRLTLGGEDLPNREVECATLAEASLELRNFIVFYNLGASQLTRACGIVKDSTGGIVARISQRPDLESGREGATVAMSSVRLIGLTRGPLTANIYWEKDRGYLWFVTRGNAVVDRCRRAHRTEALAKAAAGRALLRQ